MFPQVISWDHLQLLTQLATYKTQTVAGKLSLSVSTKHY